MLESFHTVDHLLDFRTFVVFDFHNFSQLSSDRAKDNRIRVVERDGAMRVVELNAVSPSKVGRKQLYQRHVTR